MQHSVLVYDPVRHGGLPGVRHLGFVGGLAGGLAQAAQRQQEARPAQERPAAAGLVGQPTSPLSAEEIERAFRAYQDAVVIDPRNRRAGTRMSIRATYDQRKAKSDPEQSREAPANPAAIKRVCPNHAIVYQVMDDQGQV